MNHRMPKAKKPKRDNRGVLYIRATQKVRASIEKIAAQRGYPHTVSSVAFDLIVKGLRVEAAQNTKTRAA